MQSPTPSLPTKFDNNNDLQKSIEKMSDSSRSSKATYQAIKSHDPDDSSAPTRRAKKKGGVHLNNLWSIWYGVACTGLQGYMAYRCLKKILGYSVLPWPNGLPYLELNCSLGLNGAVLLLLPIFLSVAILKIGNLANDGYKLGRQMSMCTREPPEILTTGGGCGLFRYGGPTAPFIHIAISFCLLIPKLLMEAKMIEAGFLPQEYVWHTDLDFLVIHRDRSVVLSFMTPPSINGSSAVATAAYGLPASAAAQKAAKFTTLESSLSFISSSNVTHTVMKTLKDIIGHENHTLYQSKEDSAWDPPISMEYLNLVLALVVYSIRYPAIFWSTNKCLGLIFSFQLFINGLHTLLSFAGMSILYKIHVANLWKSLPLLQRSSRLYNNFDSPTPFLLNAQVTFALYMLSTLLVLASSIVMYFYGHTRFQAFLNHQRERKLITIKGEGSNAWSYFTYCAAFCVLISIGICNAPLIHDYTVIYKGSLDDVTLICIIGGILHLFFWIVIWLFLTVKQKWTFKIRITIGQATVREQRSLRLVHDVHLNNHRPDENKISQQPLLVVGNGRTYTVTETSPKKAIMGVIQKAALIKKSKSNGSLTTNDDTEEQIYWLRPALVPSLNSPEGSRYFCWFKKKPKQKVTFNDTTAVSNGRARSSVRRSIIPGMESDDGDYATLRELPLPPPTPQRLSDGDSASEEGKLLACVQDEHITYASTNLDFTPPAVYENPNPLLDLEPVVVHSSCEAQSIQMAPRRSLKRTDSGIMAHEETLPGRSDSVSSENSASPPEPPGSSHSETSSGVHSSESNEASSVVKQPITKTPAWKSSQQDNSQNGNLIALDPSASGDSDSTVDVVITRRRSLRPNPNEGVPEAILKEDPYGRATNMRMISFMDQKGPSSATLPHYPTQPSIQNAYPNCSTMPLPQHTSSSIPQQPVITNGNSCNIYSRQHSTIPTHLNGVKLIPGNQSFMIHTKTRLNKDHQVGTNITKLEPIYTKINRASNEICHYTS